jgi:hypothetical protein
MDLSKFFNTAQIALKKNSPTILTAMGITGTVTTAYLVGKASFVASDIIRHNESEWGTVEDKKARLKERTRTVWKLYVPAAISGVTTIACIFGATKISARKTAAAAAAYSLSEKAFSEYKDKVVEKIGQNKERAIRDEIAQDTVTAKPPTNGVLVIGSGDILCLELYTGRYFNSNVETIRKSQNNINAVLNSRDEATLQDFYYMLGLPPTSDASHMGWNSDKLLDLQFSSVLAPDNRPCLAFSYNYVKPL